MFERSSRIQGPTSTCKRRNAFMKGAAGLFFGQFSFAIAARAQWRPPKMTFTPEQCQTDEAMLSLNEHGFAIEVAAAYVTQTSLDRKK